MSASTRYALATLPHPVTVASPWTTVAGRLVLELLRTAEVAK